METGDGFAELCMWMDERVRIKIQLRSMFAFAVIAAISKQKISREFSFSYTMDSHIITHYTHIFYLHGDCPYIRNQKHFDSLIFFVIIRRQCFFISKKKNKICLWIKRKLHILNVHSQTIPYYALLFSFKMHSNKMKIERKIFFIAFVCVLCSTYSL